MVWSTDGMLPAADTDPAVPVVRLRQEEKFT